MSQTSTVTVNYTGGLGQGGCAVCGSDYWCINNPVTSWNPYPIGSAAACDSKTFFDPVPAGHVVTKVVINYWTASCDGAGLAGKINGFAVPVVLDGNGGCLCSSAPCGLTTSTTGNYPCGMPGYIYGGNNTLQLCATSTAMCINRAELVFSYVDPDVITPSITPSGPLSFCPGGSVTLDAGSGYSAYHWNTGATTQTITATTTNTYTVSVTSTTGCTTGSYSVNVNVYSPPTPTITGTNSYCVGSNTLLNTGSYNSYLWSNGSTNQVTTATIANNPITVTVTDGNGCVGSSAPLNLTENALPVPIISGNQAYCSGTNTNLTTGSYSLYNWSTGSTSQTTSATIANNPVMVTVTDGNGCSGASSPLTLTQNSLPSPTISGLLTYCVGAGNTLLDAGSYSTYLWSNGATSQTINASTTDNPISVTVTDANGCTGFSPSVSVSLAPNLNPVITGSLTYCTLSSATLDAGNYSTYIWSSGATTQTISATIADNPITVTVTDASGCTGISAPVNVTLASNLSPVISGTLNYCSGSNATLDAGIYSTYIWSNGATTQTITATTTNNPYTVTVTSSSGCTGISPAVSVTQNSLPTPAITGTLVYCNGSNTTLNAGSYSSYLWSNGATTPTITATTTNNPFSVTVTDANGCKGASAPVNVSLAPELSPNITGALSYCAGTNTLLDAGVPYASYAWSTGAASQTIIATIANNPISVTVTDTYGCTGSSSVNLTQSSPQISVSSLIHVNCFSNNTGSISISATGGISPYNYLWAPSGGTSSTAVNLVAGTYTVTVTDNINCQTITSVVISQPSELIASTSYSDISCYNQNDGSISAITNGGTPPYLYLWSDNSTGNSIGSLSAGTYSLTVTDNNNCKDMVYNIMISNPPALSVSTTYTNPSCHNGTNGTAIATVTGGTPPYTYAWPGGGTGPSVSNLSSGYNTVTVTDIHYCPAISTINLYNPLALNIKDTTLIDQSYLATIDITVTGGQLPYSYSWSNGQTTEDLYHLSNGIYIITVTDFNDCISVDTININNPELPLEIPTLFSPNGDGINDNFVIKNIFQFDNVSVEIYSRWGDLLFKFSGTGQQYATESNQWNGKNEKGKDHPMGSYVYIVKIDDMDPFTGVVSIVR